MNLGDRENDLIQKYLLDNLKGEDVTAFDLLFKEPEFRSEVLLQFNLMKNLANHRIDSLSDLMAEAKAEIESTPSGKASNKAVQAKSSFSFLKLFLLAIILAGALFFFYKIFGSNTDSNVLFNKYYAVAQVENVQRGNTSSQLEENYLDALVLYSEGNFEKALNNFQGVDNPSERNILYQAICFLELNQISKATSLLSNLQSNPNKPLAQEADWYLSLLHLKNENESSSAKILKSIQSDPSHMYYEKAIQLHNDMMN